MMGYGAGLGFGFGLGGWLTFLGCALLVVGAVLLIGWAISRLNQPVVGAQPLASTTPAPDALELLRLRFARGELTAEEYASAKQVLEAGR